MPAPVDTSTTTFAEYAHPERLVSTEWLASHLDTPGLRIVESDEDGLLYNIGHIPGAVRIDRHTDLDDPVARDYLDGAAFSELMRSKGIGRDDTVVVYGDEANWWAAHTLWVFTLFGHPDVRLLDGGRDAWLAEDRETSFVVPEPARGDYPVVARDDAGFRVLRDEVLSRLGHDPLVDVRSPEEYTGERTHPSDHRHEGALRGGHIPTAVSVPWSRALRPDGRFRTRAELDALYAAIPAATAPVVYCHIGERSSHTWFVLHHLLGHPRVRNYDGSWTEWGNGVRMPIAVGADPGPIPAPDRAST